MVTVALNVSAVFLGKNQFQFTDSFRGLFDFITGTLHSPFYATASILFQRGYTCEVRKFQIRASSSSGLRS